MSHNISDIPMNLNITVLNKHYPAATKEWYNSIYSYNKNSSFIFSPTYSSSIYNTFNSYLNMKPKSIKESWNRLSSMNTFIGRPEMKHDANKITFTIYNYNRQKTYYINKLKRFINIYKRKWNSDNNFMPLIQSEDSIGELQNFIPKMPRPLKYTHKNDVELATLTPSLVIDNMLYNNIKNNPISIFFIYFNNYFSSKYEQDLKENIEKYNLGKGYTLQHSYTSSERSEPVFEIKESFFSNVKTLKKELSYKYSSSMIYLDLYKYNNNNLLSLKNIIKKIYNKKVKMNIVSLKHIYLDSNIFAEAITRKLKDRQKRILHVLKMSLSLAKKPQFKMHFYKNKIETSPYSILLDQNLNHNIDCLHNINNKYLILKPYNYKSRLLLYHIRHKIINGIRLQGTGRLTRRLTASRSISKVKYMGSLKNTYSSYENLFTVMLRGFMKSNVQYININNNNRNGAFGVKVSISSY